MKGLLTGALFSALMIFVWGFLYWAVLPTAESTLRGFPEQEQLRATLKESLPESGVYVLPYSQDSTDSRFQTLHTEGPIAMLYYREDGAEPMAPGTLVLGYLHEVLVMFIMGLMLKVAALSGYGSRVGVVFLGGLAGSVFSGLAGPIWWLQPTDLAVASLIYDAVAWLLGALVLAALVKPSGRVDANEM